MDVSLRCTRISNSYYNKGLEQARVRNLTTAVSALKKSLDFDKNNVRARDLLGLIYYEMGDVTDALVQWVICTSLDPDDEKADRYIDEIQRKPGRIDVYSQAIEKYNQGLIYAQNSNEDLAVLQLKRALEANPHYVKAYLLSALLYLKKGNYQRAGKLLARVQKIDVGNPKALAFLSAVRENAAKPTPKETKPKDGSVKKRAAVSDEDVIIPSTYKESTGFQTIVNIILGLLIGAAAVLFLYMPTRTAQLTSQHNKSLNDVNRQLNIANNNAQSLTDENQDLNNQINTLTDQLNTIQESNTYKLSQYQKFIGIMNDYYNNDLTHAADLYASIDSDQLSDIDDGSGVSIVNIYSSLSGVISAEGYLNLFNQGEAAYKTGDYDSAIVYYDKCLKINPDYTQAMLKKAMCYKQKDDLQTANNLFGEIVIMYPDTEFAKQAKAERGY